MLDHIGIAVSDLTSARDFYEQALAPLGYAVTGTIAQNSAGGAVVMFGVDGETDFVIADNERPGEGTHVAFRALTRDAVDAFHLAALAAGGRDNGGPGVRTEYGPNYYAAFVYGPDDVNVEAVCHAAA